MNPALRWDDLLAETQAKWDRSTLDITDWQRQLPATVHRIAEAWQLVPVRSFGHGAGVPVIEVETAGGSAAVLKFGPPDELNPQAQVLLADDGRSTARVLAHDDQAAALLLERLGEPLGGSVGPLDELAPLATTLLRWWQLPLEVGIDQGAKAAGLVDIIDRLGPIHGRGHERALARAREVAHQLAATESVEVVCHGDPHPANLLRAVGQTGEPGWKFVDPDGFRGERAYDLGVVVRGNNDHLLALERDRTGAGAEFVASSIATLAELTGVNAERIEQWATVERATTGLYLHLFGYTREGDDYLAAASLLADVDG